MVHALPGWGGPRAERLVTAARWVVSQPRHGASLARSRLAGGVGELHRRGARSGRTGGFLRESSMRHRIVFFFVLLSLVACWGASASVRPVAASQAGEEEIARAFQMLGEILGLPEVPPEELKRRGGGGGGARFP